jgi:agmatine deiminase
MTPSQSNYRMPAEWEPHAATWIAWPHNASDWPGKFAAIPWVYAELVRVLAQQERVEILVQDATEEHRAAGILARNGVDLARIGFHRWPTNRVWLRDSGPIFVLDSAGQPAITNWHFNAWAKYTDWQLDDQNPARVAKLLRLPSIQPAIALDNGRKRRLVLEGGSIDVNGGIDGQATLITTEECLLSDIQQRNPATTRDQLEAAFHQYLGIDQVLWLDRGCAGDDTHGHVDDITRFVASDTIVTAVEPDTADDNHAPLAENLRRLQAARTPQGKQWNLVQLPMPRPVVFRGQRLPASYANFYIANGVVLVPTFNDPRDRTALAILAELFPNREVVGIHCVDFIWGLGAWHCMTQQQPAAQVP